MTRDEVIAMARKAKIELNDYSIEASPVESLFRFADLVAARERDALSVVTPEVIEAGCEVLYGHPREKAIEWAKEDKFDGHAWMAEEMFKAQLSAAIRSRSTD